MFYPAMIMPNSTIVGKKYNILRLLKIGLHNYFLSQRDENDNEFAHSGISSTLAFGNLSKIIDKMKDS